MIPTPHTDAFLAREDLVLTQRGSDWTIETESGYPVMTLSFQASDDLPHLTAHVNTANSSRHFPMTDACLQMFWDDLIFDVDGALRWLDELLVVFADDLGRYICHVMTGRSDAEHFQDKGFTRDAGRSYRFTRTIEQRTHSKPNERAGDHP